MSTQWFYVQNGQRLGPVAVEQVKALLSSGALPQDALVWNQGLSGWVPAHTLPELAPPPAPVPVYAPPAPQPYAAPQPFPAPAPQPSPYLAPPSAALPYPAQPFTTADTGSAIPPVAVQLLVQTRPWVRLFGILGFIAIGFMVLGALFALVASLSTRAGAAVGVVGSLVYLVMAGLYVPPVLFLNRYASRITDLERSGAHQDLEAALAAQKGFWKFMGILTLVGFVLGLLGGIAAVVLGAGLLGRF